ncbi:MAG: hypothetical protein ACRD5L_18810 [Bryobacteraceae bacterium]
MAHFRQLQIFQSGAHHHSVTHALHRQPLALGAILGGVLEYSAMALGVKAMYIVAALLYAGAAFYATREERSNVVPLPQPRSAAA